MDVVAKTSTSPRRTKRRGRHPDKALSAAFVRSAPPGRDADGNGLLDAARTLHNNPLVFPSVRGKRMNDLPLSGLLRTLEIQTQHATPTCRKSVQGGRLRSTCRIGLLPSKSSLQECKRSASAFARASAHWTSASLMS